MQKSGLMVIHPAERTLHEVPSRLCSLHFHTAVEHNEMMVLWTRVAGQALHPDNCMIELEAGTQP